MVRFVMTASPAHDSLGCSNGRSMYLLFFSFKVTIFKTPQFQLTDPLWTLFPNTALSPTFPPCPPLESSQGGKRAYVYVKNDFR